MKVKYFWSMLFFTIVMLITSCKDQANNQNEQKDVKQQVSLAKIEADSFDIQIKADMQKFKIPGISFAFIKDRKIHSTRNYGVLQIESEEAINDYTMFSVGSVSKVVNAMIILKLVREGRLDLDEDVNKYLEAWKIQNNDYTKESPVTLRAILSHTAGLSVSGFPDYMPDEQLPTLIQILNGESPAKNGKVEVIYPVGSKFQYSGGGTTIAQKIIEDVTDLSYQEAANKYIFQPLELQRSSFENPLSASWGNIAKAHNENGEREALPRGYQSMPESAAAGLWTNPSDIAKILIAFYNSKEQNEHSFLSPELFDQATTRVPPSKYGLGPGITEHRGDKLMQHGGSNDSYHAYFCFYFEKGYGYVMTTNGANGMDWIDNSMNLFEDFIRELE